MSDAPRPQQDSQRESGSPPPADAVSAGDARSRTRFIEANSHGVRVRVDELGQGRPLVFLHGLLGINDYWLPTARALSSRFRSHLIEVPLLELPGRLSNVDGVARLIMRALDELINEPAVLIGSSFGGHAGLQIVLERPDLVRGLVLTGSSGLYEEPIDLELEQGFRNREVQHRPSHNWIHDKIAELFYDRTRIPDGVVDRAHSELSNRRAARTMVKLSKSARRDHMGSRLGAITTPTLVVWGRQDVVTPPRVAEEFCTLLPDARLHWIDHCGHAPMIECPDAFTSALVNFLDELDSLQHDARGRSRQEVA
ncbi:MAG: alpha/beta hydrolase [Phycisphaeraceae bacterium]|nr:MAG: alpha/beta hydrolase [Phycisphaeraceae bacterium]